jgi:hypothetical protein
LILAGDEPAGLLAVQLDNVADRVVGEPLDCVGRRLPVLLAGPQEDDAECLHAHGVGRVTTERPHLACAFLPERVRIEPLAVNSEAVHVPVHDRRPRRSTLDRALVGGRWQAVEPTAVVRSQFRFVALLARHPVTSSFAQKNPPVSLW